jgi:hypothetical protein
MEFTAVSESVRKARARKRSPSPRVGSRVGRLLSTALASAFADTLVFLDYSLIPHEICALEVYVASMSIYILATVPNLDHWVIIYTLSSLALCSDVYPYCDHLCSLLDCLSPP